MYLFKKITPLFYALPVALLLTLAASTSFAESLETAETNDVPALTFEYIYDTLQPFGKWYDTDEHGWVWRPYKMKKNWQPYTSGQWILTEQGWLWQSSFDWGWLPFHYGNWFRHKLIGWCWVPNYNWAPAWVAWYWTDKYVGWSPIPPVPEGESYEIMPEDWFFVSLDDFLSPYLYNYRIYYSVVSPDICVPYFEDNDYYFNNCCFYYYNSCRKVWIGPPCLIIEKNVKRKLKKKKVVVVKKRNTRKKYDKRAVVEIYRPTKRKKMTGKFDTTKRTGKVETAPVSKAKKVDKNQKRNERKPNVHTLSDHNLPITPIKKSPKSKKRTTPATIKRTPQPTPPPVPTVPPSSGRIPPSRTITPPTGPPNGIMPMQPIQPQPPNNFTPR